jgi:hypothetical protein
MKRFIVVLVFITFFSGCSDSVFLDPLEQDQHTFMKKHNEYHEKNGWDFSKPCSICQSVQTRPIVASSYAGSSHSMIFPMLTGLALGSSMGRGSSYSHVTYVPHCRSSFGSRCCSSSSSSRCSPCRASCRSSCGHR